MNYELAKELKDAGFPQNFDHTALYPRGYVLSGTKAGQRQSEKDRAYLPTLSELIEACSHNLGERESVNLQWYPHHQRAFAEIHLNEIQKGTTPEEAVARLWLFLKKK